jgi:hypothetical protein
MKKPATSTARLRNWAAGNIYNTNTTKEASSVRLPAWLAEKLGRIAARRDIWQFEQEEVSFLSESIRLFPDIAAILPDEFRKRAIRGVPRDLTPYERAAIIFVADCWREEVCDLWKGCTLEAKITARLEVLAGLLREGGTE